MSTITVKDGTTIYYKDRFSAMLRRCRNGATETSLFLGMTVTGWEVSISAPSGRLSEVSTSREWLSFIKMSRRPSTYAYELTVLSQGAS